jgi:hypothetical protein
VKHLGVAGRRSARPAGRTSRCAPFGPSPWRAHATWGAGKNRVTSRHFADRRIVRDPALRARVAPSMMGRGPAVVDRSG